MRSGESSLVFTSQRRWGDRTKRPPPARMKEANQRYGMRRTLRHRYRTADAVLHVECIVVGCAPNDATEIRRRRSGAAVVERHLVERTGGLEPDVARGDRGQNELRVVIRVCVGTELVAHDARRRSDVADARERDTLVAETDRNAGQAGERTRIDVHADVLRAATDRAGRRRVDAERRDEAVMTERRARRVLALRAVARLRVHTIEQAETGHTGLDDRRAAGRETGTRNRQTDRVARTEIVHTAADIAAGGAWALAVVAAHRPGVRAPLTHRAGTAAGARADGRTITIGVARCPVEGATGARAGGAEAARAFGVDGASYPPVGPRKAGRRTDGGIAVGTRQTDMAGVRAADA